MLYAANLFFGILPSLSFFVWVERNCSLPWVGNEWGWPWISEGSLSLSPALWNALLIQLFGVIHTALAQPRFARRIPRPSYVLVTGLSLIGVMGFWQPTGVVLWSPRLPWSVLQGLSFVLFWGFMTAAFWLMRGFDLLAFVGLKPPLPDGPLRRDGAYGWIRHPMYLFTLLAFFATPFMTLDRLVVGLSTLVYFAWGIPLEERKLVASMGPAYEAYRQEVPALVPRLWKKRNSSGSVRAQ